MPSGNVCQENPARNRTGRISAGGDPEQAMLNMIQSARTQTYTLHLLMVSPERYTVSGDERVERLCYTAQEKSATVTQVNRFHCTPKTVNHITHANTNANLTM